MGVKVGSARVSSDIQKAGGRALGCLEARVVTECVVRRTQDKKMGVSLGFIAGFCFVSYKLKRTKRVKGRALKSPLCAGKGWASMFVCGKTVDEVKRPDITH